MKKLTFEKQEVRIDLKHDVNPLTVEVDQFQFTSLNHLFGVYFAVDF